MSVHHRTTVGVNLGARMIWAALAAFLMAVPFLLLLLAVLGAWDALARMDEGAADSLHAVVADRPDVVRVLTLMEWCSQPWVLRAVAAVICVGLWRRGQRRLAGWLAATVTAGGLIGVLLKEVVARARPVLDDPVAHSDGYSFPSGHALNSFLFAACLVVLVHPRLRGPRRAALWGCTVLAVLLVGLDRIALGVHFLSDVLAGWVVAMAVVSATVAGFELWRRSEGLDVTGPDEGLDPEQAPREGSTTT